jgi:hypothetical protein
VDPDAIMGIYRDYVIPLTKEVEVDYLLQRLRSAPTTTDALDVAWACWLITCRSLAQCSPVSVAFLGPKASYSHQAALKYFKEGTPELLECATFSEVLPHARYQPIPTPFPFFSFLLFFFFLSS